MVYTTKPLEVLVVPAYLCAISLMPSLLYIEIFPILFSKEIFEENILLPYDFRKKYSWYVCTQYWYHTHIFGSIAYLIYSVYIL